MEEVDIILTEALNRYFKALSLIGHITDLEVFYLMLISFFLEFLWDFKDILTESDKGRISSILSCVEKSSCIFNGLRILNINLSKYTANPRIMWGYICK